MTCAKTAQNILSSSGIRTPPGESFVKVGPEHEKYGIPVDSVIGFMTFKNPYMWHKQLKEKYGEPIKFLASNSKITYSDRKMYLINHENVQNALKAKYHWYLSKGKSDPLLEYPLAADRVKIHGKL